MSNATATKPRLKRDRLPAMFRSVDLEARGIPRGHLRTLLRRGEVERVGRGIYRLAAVEPHQLETVATVASAIPGGGDLPADGPEHSRDRDAIAP